MKVGKLSEIENDSGQIIRFGNKPVIVVQTSNGDVRAFAATCTHLDCTVQFKKELGVIWCACHNGKYDLNGRNISGPPPKPLDEFRVIIKNEEVFVSKNMKKYFKNIYSWIDERVELEEVVKFMGKNMSQFIATQFGIISAEFLFFFLSFKSSPEFFFYYITKQEKNLHLKVFNL